MLLVWRTLNPALCFVLFGLAAAGLSPYPTTLGAHGPGTGVFPTWAQVLSGLINFGPSLLVVVGLLLPLVFRARGGDGGGQSGGSAKEVELPMVPTGTDSPPSSDPSLQSSDQSRTSTLV